MLHYYSIPGIRQFRSKRLTVPYSAQQLLAICPPKRDYSIPVETVIDAVCNEFLVDSSKLFTKGRNDNTPVYRFVCWKILYDHMRFTYKQCGQLFRRDHTTALAGLRRLNGYLQTDEKLLMRLNNIERSLQLPLTTATSTRAPT